MNQTRYAPSILRHDMSMFFCTCLDSVCEMLLQFFYIAFECSPIKYVICFVCMALRGVTMQCFQDVVLWTWGPHVAELVRYGSMLFVFGICSPRRPPPVALVLCNALTYFDFEWLWHTFITGQVPENGAAPWHIELQDCLAAACPLVNERCSLPLAQILMGKCRVI